MKTFKIIVYGHVQGVAYRYYTKLHADEIGIKGSVRNLSDGSVEIYASGRDDLCRLFLKRLYQGSPYSQVTDMKTEVIDFIEYTEFEII